MLVLNSKKIDAVNCVQQRFEVRNLDNSVHITDIVMPWKQSEEDTSVTPDQIKTELAALNGDAKVYISSRGGEMGAALEIYNGLKEYDRGELTAIVTGYAFSSAGWIPQAIPKERRLISTGGVFMNHNPRFNLEVTSLKDLENATSSYNAHRESILEIFEEGSGLDQKTVSEHMEAETFFSAENAVQSGYFGGIYKKKADLAVLNFAPPANLPDEYKQSASAVQEVMNARTKMLILRRKKTNE